MYPAQSIRIGSPALRQLSASCAAFNVLTRKYSSAMHGPLRTRAKAAAMEVPGVTLAQAEKRDGISVSVRWRTVVRALACPHCNAAKPGAGRHAEQEGAEKCKEHERGGQAGRNQPSKRAVGAAARTNPLVIEILPNPLSL
jgi:hypothetical protein